MMSTSNSDLPITSDLKFSQNFTPLVLKKVRNNVADPDLFRELGTDPDQSGKLDQDPDLSEKKDPDPHQHDADPHYWLEVHTNFLHHFDAA